MVKGRSCGCVQVAAHLRQGQPLLSAVGAPHVGDVAGEVAGLTFDFRLSVCLYKAAADELKVILMGSNLPPDMTLLFDIPLRSQTIFRTI